MVINYIILSVPTKSHNIVLPYDECFMTQPILVAEPLSSLILVAKPLPSPIFISKVMQMYVLIPMLLSISLWFRARTPCPNL